MLGWIQASSGTPHIKTPSLQPLPPSVRIFTEQRPITAPLGSANKSHVPLSAFLTVGTVTCHAVRIDRYCRRAGRESSYRVLRIANWFTEVIKLALPKVLSKVLSQPRTSMRSCRAVIFGLQSSTWNETFRHPPSFHHDCSFTDWTVVSSIRLRPE